MSRVSITYGNDHLEVEVADNRLVAVQRAPVAPSVSDLGARVRDVLESPLGLPPLRQSLTADDHVVIVVSEDLSHLAELLTPVIEVLVAAGVQLANVTVLCPNRNQERPVPAWQEHLPLPVRGMHIEVHDPTDRRKLSYLASTKAGRRIYLNRTLVDADQIIVIGRFGYNPVLGYGGGLSEVFPTLSDTATREEIGGKLSDTQPGSPVRPAWNEAQEVGWLLGLPFLLQVIEGWGDDHCHVLAGAPADVTQEGLRLLQQRWRVTVEHSAELVIAAISGSPAGQSIASVTQALAHAARVVHPGGQIAMLSRAGEPLGPGMTALRQFEHATQGVAHARQNKLPDAVCVWQLAHAAQHAKVYLFSDIATTTVEELFMTPLEQARQVQKLIDAAGSCLILPDAHRTLAILRKR